MDTRYKHTLGNLIRDAATDLKIPEDIREELEKALLLRNWVTHHFFREFGAVGHSHELRKEATKRLEDAWPFFEEVAGKIHQLVVERLLSSGQSQEQIQAGIQMAVESYVQEST